ncbi:MAG: pglA [Brevibacillus sp.]|nr:pglA [Brevibacillus sp.]
MANFLTSHPDLLEVIDRYYGEKQQREGQKKKWRILLATYLRYPHVGGVSNYITTLKDGLTGMGHQVDIASPNQIDLKRDLKRGLDWEIKNSAEQFCMKRYGHASGMIVEEVRKLGVFEEMVKKMDLEKYDIIHTHDRRAAFIFGNINQKLKKPLLYTPHQLGVHRMDGIEKGSIEEAVFRRLDLAAIEYARKVILVCDMFRAPFKELGADLGHFQTIHTGIAYKAVEASKPDDKVTITCVTRIEPHKGISYLLQALSLIKDELEGVDVQIVGDGPQKTELMEQAHALGLSHVRFLGTRSDIPELLSQSDIFALTPVMDTFPIAIIEAMFGSQAIITTHVGGIPELIRDHETGILIEPANATQLADKIRLLIHDHLLRKTLGANAKTYAEAHLTADIMVNKIEQAYRFCL